MIFIGFSELVTVRLLIRKELADKVIPIITDFGFKLAAGQSEEFPGLTRINIICKGAEGISDLYCITKDIIND